MTTYLYFHLDRMVENKREAIEVATEQAIFLGFNPKSIVIKTDEYGGKDAKVELDTDIVNLTPHNVDILDEKNGISFRFPTSNTQIRVESKIEQISVLDGVKIYEEKLGEIQITGDKSILDNAKGFITSRVVAEAIKNTEQFSKFDIYIPANLIRDNKGQIIGCEGLIQIKKGTHND